MNTTETTTTSFRFESAGLWEDEDRDPHLEVTILENFFSPDKADHLFNLLKEKVPWEQETLRMFGKEIPIPRLTAWFGDPEKDLHLLRDSKSTP